MARINVEQKALTDSRFAQLGIILFGEKIPPTVCAVAGLGVMIHVWNECQEQESYSLHSLALAAIGLQFGVSSDLGSAIVFADLGTNLKHERIRIKGTKGRIEWLQKRREDGQRGGRPRKTIGLDEKHPGNNPPAPAPAPTESETTTTSSNPAAPDLDTISRVKRKPRNGHDPEHAAELRDLFSAFYEDYPRHEGKQAALKAFVKLDPNEETLLVIVKDLRHRIQVGAWQPEDPERYKFIPLPATYLNGKRWEDGNLS